MSGRRGSFQGRGRPPMSGPSSRGGRGSFSGRSSSRGGASRGGRGGRGNLRGGGSSSDLLRGGSALRGGRGGSRGAFGVSSSISGRGGRGRSAPRRGGHEGSSKGSRGNKGDRGGKRGKGSKVADEPAAFIKVDDKNIKITGTNHMPLKKTRQFGGVAGTSGQPPSISSPTAGSKRKRDDGIMPQSKKKKISEMDDYSVKPLQDSRLNGFENKRHSGGAQSAPGRKKKPFDRDGKNSSKPGFNKQASRLPKPNSLLCKRSPSGPSSFKLNPIVPKVLNISESSTRAVYVLGMSPDVTEDTIRQWIVDYAVSKKTEKATADLVSDIFKKTDSSNPVLVSDEDPKEDGEVQSTDPAVKIEITGTGEATMISKEDVPTCEKSQEDREDKVYKTNDDDDDNDDDDENDENDDGEANVKNEDGEKELTEEQKKKREARRERRKLRRKNIKFTAKYVQGKLSEKSQQLLDNIKSIIFDTQESNGKSRGNVYVEFSTPISAILFRVVIERLNKANKEKGLKTKYITKFAKISKKPFILVKAEIKSVETITEKLSSAGREAAQNSGSNEDANKDPKDAKYTKAPPIQPSPSTNNISTSQAPPVHIPLPPHAGAINNGNKTSIPKNPQIPSQANRSVQPPPSMNNPGQISAHNKWIKIPPSANDPRVGSRGESNSPGIPPSANDPRVGSRGEPNSPGIPPKHVPPQLSVRGRSTPQVPTPPASNQRSSHQGSLQQPPQQIRHPPSTNLRGPPMPLQGQRPPPDNIPSNPYPAQGSPQQTVSNTHGPPRGPVGPNGPVFPLQAPKFQGQGPPMSPSPGGPIPQFRPPAGLSRRGGPPPPSRPYIPSSPQVSQGPPPPGMFGQRGPPPPQFHQGGPVQGPPQGPPQFGGKMPPQVAYRPPYQQQGGPPPPYQQQGGSPPQSFPPRGPYPPQGYPRQQGGTGGLQGPLWPGHLQSPPQFPPQFPPRGASNSPGGSMDSRGPKSRPGPPPMGPIKRAPQPPSQKG